jgi:hypothetical protein
VPRTCTVCGHKERHKIDVALVQREPYRAIAAQHGLSKPALQRHAAEHIPQALVRARDAEATANADELLSHMRALQSKTLRTLMRAEAADDLRTVLAAVQQARGNVELLAKLHGQISDAPQINIHLSSQWLEVKAAILSVAQRHPEVLEEIDEALGKAAALNA